MRKYEFRMRNGGTSIIPNSSFLTDTMCPGVVTAETWRILTEQKLFEKERGELAAKYGDYSKAMKGELDLHRCRQEIDALVNRD